MKKGLRRVAAVAVAALVVAPALATAASATSTFAFDRLAGADRYATSVAVATQYGNSTNVILASGVPGHYPDALTASYLAGVKNAPIMLTQLAATPANVLARIAASGATDIWLIGGTGVISAAQEAALDVTYTVHRLGGLDRYLTAEKVIGEGGASATTAVLATGSNFPDAIAGGPLAYAKDMPLAITATNTLPASTLAALKAAGVTKVIALGGPTIITANVLAALAAQGITLDQRIFGANRSETSSKLADYMLASQGFSNTGVNVASGYAFGTGADALGGAPLSGKENRPTLITESVTTVGPGPLAYLTAHAATLASGHIFGGVGAVSQASEDAMEAAARTAASNQTIAVAPNTAAVLAFNGTATSTTDDRQFSVAGLDATKAYTVALFPAANVTTSTAGVITFKDADSNNVADGIGDTSVANLTVLNSAPAANAGKVTTVAGATSLSFTIDGVAAGRVVVVVFQDVDADGQLDLVVPTTANANPKVPSEPFGVSGVTTYTSAEAALGASGNFAITVLDTTADFMSGTPGATNLTYNWDANDTFQFGGVGVTQAQFESVLNLGDTMAVNYNPDAAGVSVFNVVTDTVKTPGTPTAVVKNLNAGATGNDVQVTFTPHADAASGDTYVLIGNKDGAGEAEVTGATQAAGTTAGTITFTKLDVAEGSWVFKIEADSALGTASATSAASAAVVVPLSADVTAPKAIDTILTTSGGLAGDLAAGDVFKVVYNEDITAATPSLRVTDTDATPSIGDFNATNATFAVNTAAVTVNGVSRAADRVLTVTVTGTPVVVTAGTAAGIQIPATITDQGGIADLAGNLWSPAAANQDVVIGALGTDTQNDSSDVVAPVFASVTNPGTGAGTTTITLVFGEAAYRNGTFDAADFVVLNNAGALAETASAPITVGAASTSVTLTIPATTFVATQVLSVELTAQGAAKFMDAAGNASAAVTRTVTVS